MKQYQLSLNRQVIIPDDELYHWKYIKKKKVNGKWRYYYDIKDALGYDERDSYKKAKKDLGAAYVKKLNANSLNNNYQSSLFAKYRHLRDPEGNILPALRSEYKKDHARLKNINDNILKSDSDYRKAGEKYTKAEKAYFKTPLGKLEITKKKIEKAKSWLKKFLKY